MKRVILFIAILMSALVTKAQYPLYSGAPGRMNDTTNQHKKWFITKYTGISTGFMAFKGGSSTFLSAPLALQLNRQLTNNLFAFGNISATPTLFQSSNLLYQPATSKNSFGPMQTRNFGIFPAAQVGVMYISNDKTFSISGSVSVSRSNSYGYSPLYGPSGVFMQ
ncbi:hypothetical protein [Chitinophaga sp.]|uniref:hypothetical protein n=1 Tax=Chitinophaga sp. TaxID=1869181 RepID=UPI0031E38F0A